MRINIRPVLGGLFAVLIISGAVPMVHAVAPLSQYGQIQNVQNYSSNPFWSPGQQYNKRILPSPVYATGPDVETADCQNIVAGLIAVQCATQNNCTNMRVSDIRPAVMLELSRLPGHNYATACAGYIDGAFESYTNQYTNTVHPSAFPAATGAAPAVPQNEFKIKNPYETKRPEWVNEIQERAIELYQLQSQNGVGTEHIAMDEFPTTISDVSFGDRMANLAAGYAPYKDAKVYNGIRVEKKEDALNRKLASAQQERELYCIQYPEACQTTAPTKDTTPTDEKTKDKDKDKDKDKTPVTDKPEEMEALLPWFGILVVKKGSLDKYANADVPIISTEYMKEHKDEFYPANSDVPLGAWGACTHGNHTAADNDVVNRAAHMTMDEKESFWKGNDYYVYDGRDVYWGTAQLVGEIALAVLTLGGSSTLGASKAATQGAVATERAIKAQRAITLVKRAETLKKIETNAKAAGDTARAARAANLAKETRQAARLALNEAGTGPVSSLTNTDALANMARLLETSGVAQETVAAAKPLSWISALAKPWRLVKPGLTTLKPKNVAKLYGPGVSWGKRIKRAAITAGAAGLGLALVKAFGYSSADTDMNGVKFNSFGLLSADDLEGRENVVSHGAWIQFEEAGAVEEDDPLNEAMAFAEAFHEDMQTVNAKNPQCDVDIYVVQPGISNPQKMGTRSVYYVIQSKAGALRVSSK